jgi:hypothetical protein
LTAWCDELLGHVVREALPFTTLENWDRQRRILKDLFAQLFLPFSNYPAFLWAAPVSLASASHLRHLRIRPVDRLVQTRFGFPARGELPLHFGRGEHVAIDLRRTLLASPAGRSRDGMGLLQVTRSRGGYTAEGQEVVYSLEENLGLAGHPGDFDGYFPAHREFAVRDGENQIVCTTSNALFLGRLRPRAETHERAWVQYLPLPLHPHDARLMAVSAVRRDFDRFQESYPAIRALLWRHIFGGTSHEATEQ